jgi:uncharacterized membrane protein
MFSTEPAREALRREHGVRLVDETLEGAAAEEVPAGTYGFTGSPLLASPLFSVRRYRNFEVHCLATGPAVIGFVTAADAAKLTHGHDETLTIRLYPDAEGDATTIVAIAYNRVVQHRQYAIRNADALTLQVHPAHALSA